MKGCWYCVKGFMLALRDLVAVTDEVWAIYHGIPFRSVGVVVGFGLDRECCLVLFGARSIRVLDGRLVKLG